MNSLETVLKKQNLCNMKSELNPVELYTADFLNPHNKNTKMYLQLECFNSMVRNCPLLVWLSNSESYSCIRIAVLQVTLDNPGQKTLFHQYGADSVLFQLTQIWNRDDISGRRL